MKHEWGPSEDVRQEFPKLEIPQALRVQALEKSLPAIGLSFCIAALIVVVLIAIGLGPKKALGFFAVTTAAGIVCMGLRSFLLGRRTVDHVTRCGLAAMSLVMAGSWGSVALFVYHQPGMIIPLHLMVILLACGGLMMVTLSAQCFCATIVGAAALFAPFVYVLFTQNPDDWLIYLFSSALCFFIVVGFGYHANTQAERFM